MSHKKVISGRLTGLSQVIVTRTSSIGLQSGICSKLELKTFIILNTCNGIQHTTYDDINIKINLISFFKRVFAHPDHSCFKGPTTFETVHIPLFSPSTFPRLSFKNFLFKALSDLESCFLIFSQ